MKFYLAGRHERREELAEYAKHLQTFGHEITSRWLDVDPLWMEKEALAERDLEDIRRCDCLISFTEDHGSASRHGGRHVEFGYAMALGKSLVIVGPKENIFHYSSEIMAFGAWESALTWIVISWSSDVYNQIHKGGKCVSDIIKEKPGEGKP